MTHRWSGWPDAWCLDCGQDDANETCIHDVLVMSTSCPLHMNGPCPEPGSGRHDPYLRGARALLLDVLAMRLIATARRERNEVELLALVGMVTRQGRNSP